jgi:hypothetical protein
MSEEECRSEEAGAERKGDSHQGSEPDVFTNTCCYNCGGESFAWGDIPLYDSNTGGQTPMRFRPDQERPAFWQSWKTESIRARKCDRCGNIQFFATDFIGQR